MNGKFVAWVAFISAVVGILGFLGYPRYDSFFTTEAEEISSPKTTPKSVPQTPAIKVKVRKDFDPKLVGTWLLNVKSNENGYYKNIYSQWTFNKDCTGDYVIRDSVYFGESEDLIRKYKAGKHDYTLACPFTWKISTDGDGDKTVYIEYGIGELISSYTNGETLYTDQLGRSQADSYSNSSYFKSYWIQGNTLYWGDSQYVWGKGMLRDKYTKMTTRMIIPNNITKF